jgi:hypothetical protein
VDSLLSAALGGFRFHPFQGLGDIDNEARMRAASDRFDLIPLRDSARMEFSGNLVRIEL